MSFCDRAAPNAMQHASTPDANACSVRPNVAPMALVAHGKMPAWAPPINVHRSSSPVNPVASPATPVRADHSTANSARAALLPSRSATHPDGSWHRAYAAYHPSHTSPMSFGSRPSSPSIAFDGTLRAARWRYAITVARHRLARTV